MSGGADSTDLGHMPWGTLTREAVLEEREREAQRVRTCSKCSAGDCVRCVGTRCECEATPRCKRNARLSRERRLEEA